MKKAVKFSIIVCLASWIFAAYIYPAAIFHGTINALAGATMLFISGGSDLINGVAGLSGIITMAAVTLILFVYDKFISEDGIMSKKIEL